MQMLGNFGAKTKLKLHFIFSAPLVHVPAPLLQYCFKNH